MFYDDHTTKDFSLNYHDIDHDLAFNSIFGYFGYLFCFSIFKKSFQLGIVDVDYTIYLNRIERLICKKVDENKLNLGFISSAGDNWWSTLPSVKTIEALVKGPLDLRLDNLVLSPEGNPEMIDFGISSLSITFEGGDGTKFVWCGYDPEEIDVKYSLCVDSFSLMASFYARFNDCN